MESVGFIGLGHMGSKMVERLLKAGHTVIGYNRTKEKALPLIKLGMQWTDSPKDVVKACNITLMSLTDDKAISAIIEGENGILSALTNGKLLVDLSTVSPNFSRSLAITNEALTAACGQHYGDEDLSILFTSIKQMLEKK